MACNLYQEKDISALYTIVYGEINDRMTDPKMSPFTMKDLKALIKDVHSEMLDENPTNAELYAQAIPTIFNMVSNEQEIEQYLDSVDFDFNALAKLKLKFNDLEQVKIFISPPLKETSSSKIKSEIKNDNKNSKNLILEESTGKENRMSAVQDKAKIGYPDKTTGNIAIAQNPTTVSEADRNKVDAQKELFDAIVKTAVHAARNKSKDEQVFFGEIPIILKAQSIKGIDTSLLTTDDQKYLKKYPKYNIILAIISDQRTGEAIRFNEDGSIDPTGKGRIVYQYIRPVIKSEEGRLVLGNRSGYMYDLIDSEVLAEREITNRTNDGEILNSAKRKEIFKNIKEKQIQSMNDLYRLNEKLLENPNENSQLAITGGSYGIVESKSGLLKDSNFVDDLIMIFTHDSGRNTGKSYFIASGNKAGVAIDQRIYLQRIDMPKDIASKLAKILTTDLKFEGEQLSPQARLAYFNTFLSNRTKANKITADIITDLGINVLQVKINDLEVDLSDPKAEEQIYNHLLASKILPDLTNPGQTISFPANMSYMKSFAENGAIQKGVQFTDYEFIQKNGKETIREVQKDYFDFIKPLAVVDYTSEPTAYFVGVNAYLDFAVPETLTPAEEELIEIGFPRKTNVIDEEISNSEEDADADITTEEEEETEEGTKKFKLDIWKSTLSAPATITTNVNEADITFGLGTSFETKDEALSRDKAKSKWYGVTVNNFKGKKVTTANITPSQDSINNIVANLQKIGGKKINIIGNDLAVLEAAGYTQDLIDKYVYNILKEVNKLFPIGSILTTGQTGVSEAAVKAAKKLGISTKIRAFNNYTVKVPNKFLASGFKYVANTKADFVAKFVGKKSTAYKKADAKAVPVKEEKIEVPKLVNTPKTKEEQQKTDVKVNRMPIDDLLEGNSLLLDVPLERNKRKISFMKRVFKNQADINEVNAWFDKSPLKDILEDPVRLTGIINSDAYGTFLASASILNNKKVLGRITLGNDAPTTTLYHEAWHAFSQLVLTIDEKTKLYNTVRAEKNWATASYLEIEEALAEGYVDYLVTGKTPGGFIGAIFSKIKQLINWMLGKTSQRDLTRIQDIPAVKEMYETLHRGNFVTTNASVSNLMPGFQQLTGGVFNSSKIINPLVSEGQGIAAFSISESDKVVKLMDGLMALSFNAYNTKFNTSSGADKLLNNENNREAFYQDIKNRIGLLRDDFGSKYQDKVLENQLSEEPDYFDENQLLQKFELLNKTYDNFGPIQKSLVNKENKGVVAFHIQKSRFSVLKKAYTEDDIQDASSALFSLAEGNTISIKELANEDTMMLLSSIFKLDKNEDGTYDRVRDEFGVPELEDSDIMWNRLARTLQGSMDYEDMYDTMDEAQENYPEFTQLLNILPNPYKQSPGSYNNNSEFDSETNFWQDLKKPVIPYVQLTINKTVIQKAKRDEQGKLIPEKAIYESRLAKANFDIYRIVDDWRTNFSIADPTVNKFILRDILGTNVLNTTAVMAEFSRNGELIPEKANAFLQVLGISLDRSSAEINSVIENAKAPFSSRYNIDFIFENIRLVHLAGKADDLALNAAADLVKRQPLTYLLNGLPEVIEKAAGKSTNVKTRVRTLAELQNRYSDGYSNFSVLTPEKTKAWEHFLDNTITRYVTSIIKADSWQQLTSDEADPNGRFKHMRWLADENNPASKFSVLLNTIFDLDLMSPDYGSKLAGANLRLQNMGGTQLVNTQNSESSGNNTASMDVTSKFLQEFHTMLLSGVQEFMRHASKNIAMSLSVEKVKTYSSKKNDHLYVDVMAFSPKNTTAGSNFGETQGFNVILGYIAAEAGRIMRFKSDIDKFSQWDSYNRLVVNKVTGKESYAGEVFTAFHDVLTKETQEDLYNIIDDAISKGIDPLNFNLKEIINENESLRKLVKEDVIKYFNKETNLNNDRLQEAKYIDPSLSELIIDTDLSKSQVEETLIKAYTYNAWIHNYETIILAYGDLVQYNHDKEEFHKRNAGLGAGGRNFRSDFRAMTFINNPILFKRLYAEKNGYTVRPYDGTLKTAILKEKIVPESIYLPEYRERHREEYTKRFMKLPKMTKTKAKVLATELADKVLKSYKKMEIADGQGNITLESYRMLKKLEGNWLHIQEDLYKRVVNNDILTVDEINNFFPPYKLQYFGNIKTSGLPLTSFHKFSLAPIIPSLALEGTDQAKIHNMMMNQKIDYILFESGSKVGHIGKGDDVYSADGSINENAIFTENTIFAEYLKNQTEVSSSFKGNSIFSTQLRKMVLEGLYEQGVIDTLNEKDITNELVTRYIDNVSNYTELLKLELIEDLGFGVDNDGEYFPKDKDSLAKLAQLIRSNLKRDDVVSDALQDIIDVDPIKGALNFDLSLHPEANKIEKLLLSIINKKIIKQKVKGEALVQKSIAFYEGIFQSPASKFEKATDAQLKKYRGSIVLPTYHTLPDGTTSAMKIMIALQGDYKNLLNLDYKGEPIETIDRLNDAIKDDEWLDANNKANRKAISIAGVRIPVQGLNSIENMEVYHFLPPEEGNIIIPPAEIVAKSGADFDIDKLSVFMKHINFDGLVKDAYSTDFEKFLESLDTLPEGMTKADLFKMQKEGLENALIDDIADILALPQNFISLTTPNTTILVKPIADMLSEYVMKYNPHEIRDSEDITETYKNQEGKTIISPTRVLEVGYNLFKHEANAVGKKTLGLGAIENTFNVIFNALGAVMPATFTHSKEEDTRQDLLWLRHNKLTRKNPITNKDETLISLSNRFDVEGVNKIADIYSQLINGWVDVEKDAWIFFIQGNYEVASVLMYLIKTGVPIKEAVYFVSQPLVREYVAQKRLSNSTYAEPLRKSPGAVGSSFKAASDIIARYFPKFIPTNRARYDKGLKLATEYFANRKGSEKTFNETEMLDLIKDYKKNPESAGSSDLSQAMFLHYLQIEQQITGLVELKLASNPDTKIQTDVGQAIQTEATIEELASEDKIDQSLRTGLIYDSIISSFYNTPLIRGLSKPLFTFRYDKDIQNYIQATVNDFNNIEVLKSMYGKDFRNKFPIAFRNELLSYLFQNALRKYDITNEYSSYSLEESIPTKLLPNLKFGAYVDVKDGGKSVMYLDQNQIELEFNNKEWMVGSTSKTSYEKKGLYPLQPGHFTKNSSTALPEYTRFVLEREYLRSVYPMKEVADTQEFKKEFANITKTAISGTETTHRRLAYEKILVIKALDNTLNPYHLFNDKDSAYAIRYNSIREEYKKELQGYKILQRLQIDNTKDNSMFNLYLNDKDMNTFSANNYTKELEQLADRNVEKVANKEENNRISDFFSKMTFFAMMQAGISKSKYNFLGITNFESFTNIMETETKDFLSSGNKEAILNDYFATFEKENSITNTTRNRFRNFITKLNLNTGQGSIVSENLEEDINDTAVKRANLLTTSYPNVFIYNELLGTENIYKYMVSNNTDVTFIYNMTLSQEQNPDTARFKGQSSLKKLAGASSVGLVTNLNKDTDSFNGLDSEYYKDIKDLMEEKIQEIKNVIQDNGNVAFSNNGYGDPALMPSELFVYLSRRLFEEFGYLNPGSELLSEVSKQVAEVQDVTDAEIMSKFDNENNPLSC